MNEASPLRPRVGEATIEAGRAGDEGHAQLRDLEDFFENGAVALHIVSEEGIILRANRAELALLGYSAEEYIGQPIAAFHADPETIADILERLHRGEKLDRYPARLRAKDGTLRHVQITSSGKFHDGRFVSTRCFTVDVTADLQAKQTEDSLRRRMEEQAAHSC